MDPVDGVGSLYLQGIPRARGDGPGVAYSVQVRAEDSPRSRGWTLGRDLRGRARLGFPALAGMDLRQDRSIAAPCRIPRARGDGPVVAGENT